MVALIEIGEDPQVWRDLMFAHGSWTWASIREAPEWVAGRAILWADVLGAWQKAEADKAAGR